MVGGADILVKGFREHLVGDATLQDLPDEPVIVLGATNVQTGVTWRFRKDYMGDYRVGLVHSPSVPLAVAVAASSAFSPLHWPVPLKLSPDIKPVPGADLHREPFISNVLLADGSLHDLLAL